MPEAWKLKKIKESHAFDALKSTPKILSEQARHFHKKRSTGTSWKAHGINTLSRRLSADGQGLRGPQRTHGINTLSRRLSADGQGLRGPQRHTG